LDFSRLRDGEIVAAAGGFALFVFMFFHWFSGVSGWDALQDFSGFLIALAAVSGVALGGLAASGKRLNLGEVPRGAGTAALGSLAVLLILWRFLANPGDLRIGIFLGLAAAIAVAVGALMALREDGFEPFVNVPGGRTKVASASAPAPTAVAQPVTAPSGGSVSGASGSGASRSSGGSAAKTRSSRGTASKSRSRASTAAKRRSGGRSTAAKRRSSGESTATKRRSGGAKTKAKSGTTSRSKSGSSTRSRSSASSKTKPKSGGSRSRTKSSGGSKSSGTRRRSSGKRK